WTRAGAGAVGEWKVTDPTGAPFKSPDSMWKHVLHDGFVTGTASSAGGVAPGPSSTVQPPPSAAASAASGLEIIFRPDPTIWDGRFANNGWLQELPKPLTKIT